MYSIVQCTYVTVSDVFYFKNLNYIVAMGSCGWRNWRGMLTFSGLLCELWTSPYLTFQCNFFKYWPQGNGHTPVKLFFPFRLSQPPSSHSIPSPPFLLPYPSYPPFSHVLPLSPPPPPVCRLPPSLAFRTNDEVAAALSLISQMSGRRSVKISRGWLLADTNQPFCMSSCVFTGAARQTETCCCSRDRQEGWGGSERR